MTQREEHGRQEHGRQEHARPAPVKPTADFLDKPIEAGAAWTLISVGDDLLVERPAPVRTPC